MTPKALSREELKCGNCGKWEVQEIGVFHAQWCKQCLLTKENK